MEMEAVYVLTGVRSYLRYVCVRDGMEHRNAFIYKNAIYRKPIRVFLATYTHTYFVVSCQLIKGKKASQAMFLLPRALIEFVYG